MGQGPLDIAVRPGFPETVVVSTGLYAATSPFQRVTVYDAGIPRPQSLEIVGSGAAFLNNRAPEIEFADENTVLSMDNETSDCSLQRLTLVPNGLVYRDSKARGVDCFGWRLQKTSTGRFFSDEGVEFDPSTLSTKSSFYGVVSAEGQPAFHAELDSLVRVNPFNQSEVDPANPRLRMSVEEFPATRRYRKRVYETDEASIPGRPTGPFLFVVIDVVAVGLSRVVFSVFDANSGAVTVMSKNLADVPELPSLSFAARTSSAGPYTVKASNLPVLLGMSGYDAIADQFVFALPASIGPSGSSLAAVDPTTGLVDRLIPLPGEPLLLVVARSARIAYVRLRGLPDVLKVDLTTGAVLARTSTVPVRAMAVHGSDPDVLAVFTTGANGSPLGALATLRNLVPEGPRLEALDDRDLDRLQLLYSHGADQLVGVDLVTTTPVMGRFRFTTGGGLSKLALQDGRHDLHSRSPKYGFGRISTVTNVVDVETVNEVGRLPAVFDDFLLDSAVSGIGVLVDGALADDSISITWLKQQGQDVRWSPRAVLRIDDALTRRGFGAQSSAWSTDIGGGRFAVVRFKGEEIEQLGTAVYFVSTSVP